VALEHLAQSKTAQIETQAIRVLFLNTRDSLGADVAVHLSLARWLDRAQTEVWAATSTYEAPGSSTLAALRQIPDLTVLPLDLGRPLYGLRGAGRALALLRNVRGAASLARLALQCRRQGIDLIHVTERPRDALFGLLLARVAGCTCLIHAHTSYYRHDATRLFNWTFARADAVVGVSEFTAKTYTQSAGLPEERVFAVHNAVDGACFSPAVPSTARLAMRARFGIPAAAPLIGCVARLSRWKGQAELVEALVAVRQTLPEARLLLAGGTMEAAPDGNGDFRAYLERRVVELGLSDAVIFAGFLPYDEMPAFFGALDVLAHPAVEEPFGLAIVEAMASERPVVAVRAGGVPEIIRDGVDGLLAASNTPDELAVELLRVLGDADLSGRLGRAGRLRVERLFSPRRQAEAMAAVYRRVLGYGPIEQP